MRFRAVEAPSSPRPRRLAPSPRSRRLFASKSPAIGRQGPAKVRVSGGQGARRRLGHVQDISFGSRVRGVRVRLGLRQADVAERARVSSMTVSRIERGHLEALSVRTIRSVASVLDIRADILPRWRGGDLDRLVNASHARLAQACIRRIRETSGWEVRPEVSFSIYGERGVIDLLAWHPERRALLVVELKTAIIDVGELLGTLDRKVRLAREVAARFDWAADASSISTSGPTSGPTSVALVVADGRTNRRRIADHVDVFRSALPDDGRRLAAWLRRPVGSVAGLMFLPDKHPRSLGQPNAARQRVRRPRTVGPTKALSANPARDRARGP